MNEILFAVLLVGGIGLIIGVILAVASIAFAVPKDEKAEAVLELLPGANCGACGFSGCSGYAKALANGSAGLGLCAPGGEETSNKISEILGVSADSMVKMVAIVHCEGNTDNTQRKFDYAGLGTCAGAAMLHNGTGDCKYGCLGFGDCVSACPFDAIMVCNGVAQVNSVNCKGCAMCVSACPKKLIALVPAKKAASVRCSNCDKGAQTRKDCKVGCIGCMRCVKACEAGAIKMENFHAVIDADKCTACGKCVEVCSRNCITLNNF